MSAVRAPLSAPRLASTSRRTLIAALRQLPRRRGRRPGPSDFLLPRSDTPAARLRPAAPDAALRVARDSARAGHRIRLKREGTCCTPGRHKLNNALGQALLASAMGTRRVDPPKPLRASRRGDRDGRACRRSFFSPSIALVLTWATEDCVCQAPTCSGWGPASPRGSPPFPEAGLAATPFPKEAVSSGDPRLGPPTSRTTPLRHRPRPVGPGRRLPRPIAATCQRVTAT